MGRRLAKDRLKNEVSVLQDLFERMTIAHFWDSIVTIGNLPIRKS